MTVSKQSGLSLIELMVTIAVLAILATVAVPSMIQYINRARLVSVAEELQRDIQFARSETIRNNRPVLLTVKTGSQQCYGLTAKTSACNCTLTNAATNNYCELKRQDISSQITLSKGVDVALSLGGTTGTSGNFSSVGFDPIRSIPFDTSTSAVLSNDQTLQLENASGKQLHLVLSVTGRATLCSPSGSTFAGGYPNGC
ncbi:Tfp pilus assembly protein FimT/FimU [Chitinibacter sp. S2-10]|uniref:Tfp pilus assembly protein FimT/FimU n=1 Tax=Chitinibacter sp. S2-10 TaxID=3373597 RepID=UPI00397777AF